MTNFYVYVYGLFSSSSFIYLRLTVLFRHRSRTLRSSCKIFSAMDRASKLESGECEFSSLPVLCYSFFVAFGVSSIVLVFCFCVFSVVVVFFFLSPSCYLL